MFTLQVCVKKTQNKKKEKKIGGKTIKELGR